MPNEIAFAALAAATRAEKKIPGAVSAWLQENVDPETGYVLDSSLTVAGAAADAKAAGDAVGEIKSALDNLTDEVHGEKDYLTFPNTDAMNMPHVYIHGTTHKITTATGYTNRVAFAECQPNTTYYVTKTGGSRFAVGYITTNAPAVGDVVYGYNRDDSAAMLSVTTGNDATYLAVYYAYGDSSYATIFSTLKAWSMVSTGIDGEILGIDSRLDVLEKNEIDLTAPLGAIGVFPKFGVIGASFDSGVVYNSSSQSISNYSAFAWGQQLSRKYGITCDRYSWGGCTCYDWLTNAESWGLNKLKTSGSDLNLVLVTLGANDQSRGFNLGSLSDLPVSLPENIPENQSFVYYYGCIILAVQQYAPNAMLILCHSATVPNTTLATWYAMIDSIAELYNLPIIKQETDPYFAGNFYKTQMVNYHPVAVSHAGMAAAYDRLIAYVVRDFPNYFKGYHT